MNNDLPRRVSTIPAEAPGDVPLAPPLPAPKPLQRAREAAYRFIGYPARPQSAHDVIDRERFIHGPDVGTRYASLGTQNATASHKTGLEINTIAINEKGTHALLGGKEIFKTIRVEEGKCAEELNLRTAIRSTPFQASGKPRQVYSIDIADVAWAKGDCGDYVAAATSSGKIILYDLGHAGLQAAQLHEHFRQVHKVTFNPHRGNLLLSSSQDGTVRLWDLRDVKNQASTLQSKRKYSGQSDGIRDVKWSPTEGVDFAFGTDSGWIQRWDIRNLKAAKVRIPAHSSSCNTIDWHPDGKHIVSAGSDRTVRVWDFSSNRKQKHGWEIKTPYPVMNARWRPSYESSMMHDNGARLCTQVVTAYDREHPMLHVWDFRRPALPFREACPYSSAPTDLLWHSQDLLWTVGREGVFLQSDIQHAPKSIEKRNLQSFGVSPLGDVNFVTQPRRVQRRHPKLHELTQQTTITQSKQSKSLSGSPEATVLGRSWTDDTLDQSFLSVIPTPGHTRANSSNSKAGNNGSATLKLDEVLSNRKSFRPHQSAARGLLPYHAEPKVLKYLAKQYVFGLPPVATNSALIQALKESIDKNAAVADAAGLYRLAQSWRIIGFVALSVCNARIKAKEMYPKDDNVAKQPRAPSLGTLALKMLGQTKSSAQSPASIRPISALAQQLAGPESTSNVPTPLARPVPSSRIAGFQDSSKDPDFDGDEKLTLPPSVTNQFMDKPAEKLSLGQRLTSGNLNDWEKRQAEPDRSDTVKRWSIQPKTPLNLGPTSAGPMNMPPKLQTWDSDESFSFLASTDSGGASLAASVGSATSGPNKMVSERPSRPLRAVSERPPTQTDPPIAADALRNRPTGDSTRLVPIPARSANERSAETNPSKSVSVAESRSVSLLEATGDDEIDVEEGKPFTLVEMVRELIAHHSLKSGDAQTAAQLLTLLMPLLPPTHPLPDVELETTVSNYADTYVGMGHMPEEVAAVIDKYLAPVIHAGLQPLQVEAILSTYHEQLQAHQLFNEAAQLRIMAYPTYPAVYEDSLKDNDIHLKCSDCGNAIQFGSRQLHCKNCPRERPVCPYCWLDVSPFGESKLFSACMLCGHSAHADCLHVWFVEHKGDGCPNPGCLCDCVAGAWREEKMKIVEKQQKAKPTRVKSDDWRARESLAVDGAREFLRGGSGPSA